MNEEEPDHDHRRTIIRIVGVVFVIAGFAFIAISMYDVFSSDLDNRPTLHYLAFYGMPLLFVGFMLLSMSSIQNSKLYAGDITPPGVKTMISMGNGTQPGVNVGMVHGQGTAQGMQTNEIPPPEYIQDQESGRNHESSEPKGTIRERLEKLQTLHKDGLIDDMDYEDQKDRILNDL